jgi:hypothetical protein
MCTSLPNGQTRILDGQAPRRHALVGAVMGVGFLDVNARHSQIQLMSRHQLQCMQDALAQFDFAREHRHSAIGFKAQPLRQQWIDFQTHGGDEGLAHADTSE